MNIRPSNYRRWLRHCNLKRNGVTIKFADEIMNYYVFFTYVLYSLHIVVHYNGSYTINFDDLVF